MNQYLLFNDTWAYNTHFVATGATSTLIPQYLRHKKSFITDFSPSHIATFHLFDISKKYQGELSLGIVFIIWVWFCDEKNYSLPANWNFISLCPAATVHPWNLPAGHFLENFNIHSFQMTRVNGHMFKNCNEAPGDRFDPLPSFNILNEYKDFNLF